MDITLIETNKGQKSIVCDGYRYRVDVELKSGEIAWRCTSKGCKARICTDSSAIMILQQKNSHDHETDDRQIERHVLRVSTKRKTIDDMSSRPSKIISTELQSMMEEAESFLAVNDADNKVIIFTCHRNIECFCDVDEIFMDGTFKCCPKFFQQMYTIHGYK